MRSSAVANILCSGISCLRGSSSGAESSSTAAVLKLCRLLQGVGCFRLLPASRKSDSSSCGLELRPALLIPAPWSPGKPMPYSAFCIVWSNHLHCIDFHTGSGNRTSKAVLPSLKRASRYHSHENRFGVSKQKTRTGTGWRAKWGWERSEHLCCIFAHSHYLTSSEPQHQLNVVMR